MGKPFTPDELKKFNKIKEMVLTTVQKLDNNKQLNIQRYKELFDVFEKDPDQFRNWDVLNSNELDSTIQIFALPFEETSMTQIKDAADYLKIPLEEYVYFRQHDPKGLRTKMKVPVGLTY